MWTEGFGGRGLELALIAIVFAATSFSIVVLRLVTRFTTQKGLGSDDFLIAVALLFNVVLSIANCLGVFHGYGNKIDNLTAHDRQQALKYFWISQIVYKAATASTKNSILALYLRIFPAKNFRYQVFGVIAFVTVYFIACFLTTIFQCRPITYVYNKSGTGQCINLTAFWYANAIQNILTDFLILILPMPRIYELHLPARQKIGLAIIFSLGSFVCVTSILRMTTLNSSSKSSDQTYGTYISTIWTTVESNTGIICASLITLKAPLEYVFPSLFPPRSSDAYCPRPACLGNIASQQQVDDCHQSRIPSSQSVMISSEKPESAGTGGDRESSGRELGIVVPLGSIGKTTELDVRYEDQFGVPMGGYSQTSHFQPLADHISCQG